MGRIAAILIVAIIVVFGVVWILGLDKTVAPPAPIDNGNGTSTTTPTTTPATISYKNADSTMIQVTAPLAGQTVAPVFTLSGQARGPWYFEASFPIEILDPNGARLLMVPVQAQGEWMTTEFVPFSTQVSVPNYRGPATLILHKDNPSGMPENDASISMPIVIQ